MMAAKDYLELRKIRRMRIALLPLAAALAGILWMAVRSPQAVYFLILCAMAPIFGLVYLLAHLARTPCPRCDRPMLSAPEQGLNLLSDKCIHCGLPLRAAKVIYPSME